ncbi:hypothetical protein BDV96DRAFT_113596 [Lophiotrema nucula]|uniref:alpha-glucosidase n=1 Tax=Lophiotrema nucula TaxID=690887 RepID=A0A6A5Z281_9PLEO|nr:hypothetical protein BDV96DRAFT_113596 [Lophiotrema nucula]
MMSGIPLFGANTCGSARNTDSELCSRWMELRTFLRFSEGKCPIRMLIHDSPIYRTHDVRATIGQKAYRVVSVPEASRCAMAVRYSLLTYMYTLFYYAHE